MNIKILSNGYTKHEDVLKNQLNERIPVSYKDGGMTIEFKLDDTFALKESYKVEEIKDNHWLISGKDELGIYYGIGKFLHSAKWNEEGFVPRGTMGIIAPDCPFRAVYTCCHLFNFYEMAPIHVLEKYLEDLLLWGYNTIHGILSVVGYDSADDPGFKKATEQLRRTFKIAKSLGMKISFCIVSNQAFLGAPHEIDNDPNFNQFLRGNFGRNVCLSKPEGWSYMEKLWKMELETFKDIGLDYIKTWPYDEGGCGCEKCRPWGSNMFLKGSKAIYEMAKEMYPEIKSILSTWGFDAEYDEGEYSGLYDQLTKDMSYLDYIMVDSHESYPEHVLNHDLIKPVINFPEVSMYHLYPWGGFGANPLLMHFDEIWQKTKHILSGGEPYSEGIYEDISKIQFAGYYWDKNRDIKDIMAEYISYEFDEKVVDDVYKIMLLVEENHINLSKKIEPDLEKSQKAKDLAEKVNDTLNDRVKKSWRWRILYIRVMLDFMRYSAYYEGERNEDNVWRLKFYSADLLIENKDAQNLFKELRNLYYSVSFNGLNGYTLPPLGGTSFHKDFNPAF